MRASLCTEGTTPTDVSTIVIRGVAGGVEVELVVGKLRTYLHLPPGTAIALANGLRTRADGMITATTKVEVRP